MAARHFTKTEAQAAAKRAQKRPLTTASNILREAMDSVKEEESFDIFLSHAVNDADLCLG